MFGLSIRSRVCFTRCRLWAHMLNVSLTQGIMLCVRVLTTFRTSNSSHVCFTACGLWSLLLTLSITQGLCVRVLTTLRTSNSSMCARICLICFLPFLPACHVCARVLTTCQDVEFLSSIKCKCIINCAGAATPNLFGRFGIRYLTYRWADCKSTNIFDDKVSCYPPCPRGLPSEGAHVIIFRNY